MLRFLQKNRASKSDNELMKRAILGEGQLEFEFKIDDAKAVESTFVSNYRRESNDLTLLQGLRIFIGNAWNSSYGSVVRFIIYMGPLNLDLKVVSGMGAYGAQLHVRYTGEARDT
jgi:hypothetical protein